VKYASVRNEKPIINVVEHEIKFSRQLSDLEYIMIGVIAISLLSVGMNAGVMLFQNMHSMAFSKGSHSPMSIDSIC